jgi:hypothetical protein
LTSGRWGTAARTTSRPGGSRGAIVGARSLHFGEESAFEVILTTPTSHGKPGSGGKSTPLRARAVDAAVIRGGAALAHGRRAVRLLAGIEALTVEPVPVAGW